jgi:hypothetical protein
MKWIYVNQPEFNLANLLKRDHATFENLTLPKMDIAKETNFAKVS